MSMHIIKSIIALYIYLISTAAFAHVAKEGNVWVTTGPLYYRTYTTKSTEADRSRWGVGLIAQADVDKNGGLEIGMVYLDKLYFRNKNHHLMVEKIKRIFITTGYRHWITNLFSVQLAFFSSYSMGDPIIIEGDFERREESGTTARETTEYGFDVSLQWEIWGTDNVAVVADGRYDWSTSSKSKEDANVYGALLGVKYKIPKTRSSEDVLSR